MTISKWLRNVIKKITGRIKYNKSIKDIQYKYQCNINNIKKLPTDNVLWDKKSGHIDSCCIVFSARISTVDLVRWVKNSRFNGKVHFSIGKFFKGKYVGNGKLYDKESVCIEVSGIPSSILIKFAIEIAKSFKQVVILVKDYSNGKNLLIDIT